MVKISEATIEGNKEFDELTISVEDDHILFGSLGGYKSAAIEDACQLDLVIKYLQSVQTYWKPNA